MNRARLMHTAASLIAVFVLTAGEGSLAAPKPSRKISSTTTEKKLFTGKVVMLRDALKRKGITAFKEIDKQVVLETPAGKLIPIVPDWRGRALYQDKRLRDRKISLVGFRREGVPYLQVLMIFTYDKKGKRKYTDYWCDICSIPMYEIKPCDCCQAPNRLRFQSRSLPDYLSRNRQTTQSRPVPAKKPSR